MDKEEPNLNFRGLQEYNSVILAEMEYWKKVAEQAMHWMSDMAKAGALAKREKYKELCEEIEEERTRSN